MTAKADPGTLQTFVATGRAARLPFDDATATVRFLRSTAHRAFGDLGPSGNALERFDELLGRLHETEQFVAGVENDLRAADAPLPVTSADLGLVPLDAPSAGYGRGVTLQGVAEIDDEPIPWLDPETDSLVVNVVRTLVGQPLTTPFVRRVMQEGPDALGEIAEAGQELSLPNQVNLLVTDPYRFLSNWKRAGESAVSSVTGSARFGLGLATVLVPGLDDSVEMVTGERVGPDSAEQLGQVFSLLVDDPDELAEAAVGWDQLADDPYAFLGGFAPDALLSMAGGVPAISARMRRVARVLRSAERADPPGGTPLMVAGEGPRRLPDLDVQRKGEPEWGVVDTAPTHRDGPFEPPERWVADLNGHGVDSPGRSQNCVDCARAVEANWRGDDAVAAPTRDGHNRGTSADRLEDWTGGRMAATTIDDIEAHLLASGPGSSALVTSSWKSGGAHAYNAVNDGGVIKWVDGQLGQSAPWPPVYGDHVDDTIAIFMKPDGSPE